ncbi:MAG: hypothetical protein GX660_10955 [Clostridiaceae bacterium]|nr:hypothetical protein [Clostridiaceae bacterium]
MYVILSQKVDVESSYSDELFNTYHFPMRYRNQLHTGDIFVYYQGNRYDQTQRYYFGTGVVGQIYTPDGDSYYAELVNCQKFEHNVPIYLTNGGYIEQKGYAEVRKSINPPWQSSIRPLSEEAYKYIVSHAGKLESQGNVKDLNTLKEELKHAVKDFYVGKDNSALIRILKAANTLTKIMSPEVVAEITESLSFTTDQARMQLFDYCKSMRMSYSYKPVLIMALIESGKMVIKIDYAVSYFRRFYDNRRKQGLKVEKGNCIYHHADVSDTMIADNIVSNPVKALTDSGYFAYDASSQTFGFIESIASIITAQDRQKIIELCKDKLNRYYSSK